MVLGKSFCKHWRSKVLAFFWMVSINWSLLSWFCLIRLYLSGLPLHSAERNNHLQAHPIMSAEMPSLGAYVSPRRVPWWMLRIDRQLLWRKKMRWDGSLLIDHEGKEPCPHPEPVKPATITHPGFKQSKCWRSCIPRYMMWRASKGACSSLRLQQKYQVKGRGFVN